MAVEQADYDIVIRGGTVLDGSGGDPFVADVGLRDGRIERVGTVLGLGREEIDAIGLLVTPGFVDIHTHFDAQSIWESRMAPASEHGVTTVVFGNCGVGFAPCRQQDREGLIALMEGVEDIPEVVMSEGLTWEWESYPEFLDAVAQASARRQRSILSAPCPSAALCHGGSRSCGPRGYCRRSKRDGPVD